MQYFAQISDPHLSSLEGVRPAQLLSKRALGYLSWSHRRRHEHRTEVLDALQRDLKQFELDQLLVTGDLTHVGLPEEFRQALSWLQSLGNPKNIAVIAGNHDASVATPWQDTFALWREYMASDQGTSQAETLQAFYPTLRERGNIAFIGLNTACPKPPLMATGTVGEAQLSRLPALLDRAHARGQFRVVYLHHSPMVGKDKWRKRLTDAEAVQSTIMAHGAELVLNGHGHRNHYDEFSTCHGQAPLIAIPSASSMGLHGGQVASYNHYGVNPTATGWYLSINSRQFDPSQQCFVPSLSRTVDLTRKVPAKSA
ncbi:MAG: metallophosphoesterase [Pseudomonadota bacterium]